jgi:hypothetical protein
VFDGQDDYLEIPNCEAINFSQNQDFAIELWLKVGAISTEPKPVFLGDVNVIEKWQGKGFPYAIRYSAMQGTIYAARYDGNNPSLTWPIPLNDQNFTISLLSNKVSNCSSMWMALYREKQRIRPPRPPRMTHPCI